MKHTIIFLLFSCFAKAQSVGIKAGYSIYNGDLSERLIITPHAPTVSLYAEKDGIRLSFEAGQFSGSDKNFDGWRQERGLSFKSNFLEITLQNVRKFPYFYSVIGAGYLSVNPTTDYNNLPREKDFAQNHILAVFGIGREIKNFSVETIVKCPFTDYLDGVSTLGNQQNRDWYFTLSLGYRFSKNKETECYKF